MRDYQEIDKKLNELRQANYDAERFCTFASENTHDEEEGQFYQTMANQHKYFRKSLREEITRHWGRAVGVSDVFNDAIDDILWEMNNTLTQDDDRLMLLKLSHLESTLLRHYDQALSEEDLPSPLQSILLDQKLKVEGFEAEIERHQSKWKKAKA